MHKSGRSRLCSIPCQTFSGKKQHAPMTLHRGMGMGLTPARFTGAK